MELESEPDSPWRAVALATLGAARHFRGASSDEVAALLEQAVAMARSGANSMAVLRAQGTLAAAAFAAGDRDGASRWAAAADRLRAQQSLEEYWMGSLATAVAGQLAADAGDLEEARERLERAVVLALRGAARPEHIYALAALAPDPVHAGLGGRAHQRADGPGEVGPGEGVADRAVQDRRVDGQQADDDPGRQGDPPAWVDAVPPPVGPGRSDVMDLGRVVLPPAHQPVGHPHGGEGAQPHDEQRHEVMQHRGEVLHEQDVETMAVETTVSSAVA